MTDTEHSEDLYDSFLEAIRENDYLGSLMAMRDYLAMRIDNGISGRDLAPTINALKDVLETIDTIQSAEGDPDTEEIVNGLSNRLSEMGNVVKFPA